MSEENINDIIKKYKAGTSSLEEEKILFNSTDLADDSIKPWASFVKKTKIETPENFNEKLWTSFDAKTKNPSKLKVGVLSAAASIALIFSLLFYNSNKSELSESKKSVLLEEAKSMFADKNKEKAVYKKILENDLIIVYSKTN